MSERGIIFLVVVALLAVAFFFPYESSDDEYYRTHGKKPLVQKAQGETDSPRHTDGKGMGDSRLAIEDPIANAKPAEFSEPGARAADEQEPLVPDFTPLIEQISIAKEQINRHRGGFMEGKRLDGKYVLMTHEATTLPTSAVQSAAYIVFRADGTFTEYAALSFSSNGGTSRTPDDLSGHYYLKGYVFTIDQLAPSVDAQPNHEFSICPLGGENDKGMPLRLYIDGKVFKLPS